MPELYKRDNWEMTPCGGVPWWNSTGPQMHQSRNLSFKMATPPKPILVHDQDSSSTQSTGQSYPEVACVGETEKKTLVLKESGSSESHEKREEGHAKSTVTSQDYAFLPTNVEYKQSFGSIPFTYPDTYCHGLVTAYGPHTMVQPQMMCMTASTRVPLPLDLTQDEPIYVNAKQYSAILRRRQYRAKLEAQNKLLKNRKPYLHESRHRHALNRVRGPGGRFLNQKKLEESKTPSSGGGGGGSGRVTTTSSSGMTSVSDVDNIFHHQQEFDFSVYPSRIVQPMHHHSGGGSGGGVHHYLSIPH